MKKKQLCDSIEQTIPVVGALQEATHRTTRWLNRCIAAHARPQEQSLFAIVQGGTDQRLRDISLKVEDLDWW